MPNDFKQSVLDLTKETNTNILQALLTKLDPMTKENEDNVLQFLENFDERCFFTFLFMHYMYQVNNGGHAQYFDNGYASYDTFYKGYFSNKSQEFGLHEKMIFLFKKYFDVKNNLIYSEFLSILDAFKENIFFEDCTECDSSGELEYEDEDGLNYETCTYCNGTGQSDILTFNTDSNLDDKFYEICDKLLDCLNTDINQWFLTDNIITFDVMKIEKKPKIKLIGTDGNAFAILGKCEAEFKRLGKQDLIPEFRKKATSGDYNNLLCVCMEYFDVF